jgi:hypothetical protein
MEQESGLPLAYHFLSLTSPEAYQQTLELSKTFGKSLIWDLTQVKLS